MGKLSNNELNDHLAEDHTCHGCLMDTLDCKCIDEAMEDWKMSMLFDAVDDRL